jgi:phage shock protein A
MFRAVKRLFIWLGLVAETATETDAINQAVIERGIRDARARADQAHYANGQLAGQIALLKDQVKRQARHRSEVEGMVQACIAANDEENGARYAEELACLDHDLEDNRAQMNSLEQLYQQNTRVIAESLREIRRFQREFETVKARAAMGRSLKNLSGLVKGSISELQGMTGGEMSQSMEQLRQAAAGGEGQMRASLDLAKAMGSDVQGAHGMRKARGTLLFQEYKKKMGLAQSDSDSPALPGAARQRIPEP